MYAFSSKSGSEPFRALGDLTWNDPIAGENTTIDMDHMVLNGPNFFAMICSGMPIIVGSENVGAARLLIILNIKLRPRVGQKQKLNILKNIN